MIITKFNILDKVILIDKPDMKPSCVMEIETTTTLYADDVIRTYAWYTLEGDSGPYKEYKLMLAQ